MLTLRLIRFPIQLLALAGLFLAIAGTSGTETLAKIFSGVSPEMTGYFLEPDSFVPANALKAPDHIAPLWYFSPNYSILKSIDNKFLGTLAMFISFALLPITLLVLTILLVSNFKNKVKRYYWKNAYLSSSIAISGLSTIGLGILAYWETSSFTLYFGRVLSAFYFGAFMLSTFSVAARKGL